MKYRALQGCYVAGRGCVNRGAVVDFPEGAVEASARLSALFAPEGAPAPVSAERKAELKELAVMRGKLSAAGVSTKGLSEADVRRLFATQFDAPQGGEGPRQPEQQKSKAKAK